MCGRVTVRTPAKELAQALGLELGPGIPEGARFNVAPSQPLPAVLNVAPRTLVAVRWGLVPRWASDPKIANKLSNARSESVRQKPAFRDAFKHRRCVLLVDGFYEWKRDGAKKRPFLFHRVDDQPFPLAGLWEEWTGPDGTLWRTCTVLTCGPNPVMAPIHDRMPVVIPPEKLDSWLAPETDEATLTAMLQPIDASYLRCDEVSSVVNDARHEGPDCIAPPAPKDPTPPKGQMSLL